MKRLWLWALALALGCALGLASGAGAQEEATSEADAGIDPSSGPAAPEVGEAGEASEGGEASEASEVSAEAPTAEEEDPRDVARDQLRAARVGEITAHTRAALQVARPLLRMSGEVTRIERALPRTETEIRRLSHPARLARIPHLSQRELSDLRQDWRRHAHRLEGWQQSIAERESEVEEARTALVELKRTWSGLRDLSDLAGQLEPRHGRIVSGLDETRRGLAELDEMRESLAALSDRVSDVQIVVEDVADQLRDAASVYRERLMVRDAPPLHLGLTYDEDTDESAPSSVGEEARAALLERTETPEELLAELLPSAAVLLVVFVVLFVLLVRLARGGPGDNEGTETSGGDGLAAEVLKSPASSAALLALLGASVFLEHAPVIVYDALFFATLVPLYRAVPPLSTAALRPVVRGAIVFAAIDRVQSMLAEGSGVLRVVLLLEAAAAVAAIAYFLRVRGAGVRLWARALVLVTMLTLSVALVANVVGYLFLATVLTRGVGYSVYTALALAGAVAVSEAIVDRVVVSRTGRRLRAFRDHSVLVRANTLRALTVVAGIAWLVSTLEGFGLWGPFSTWARKVLREDHDIGSLEISVGAVLGAVGILVGTSLVLRFVRFVLEQDVLPRVALEPGVDGAISGLTRYVLGGTGLLFALAFLGIDASQIALERPVRLGDFIEVGSLVGSVDRIGLRSSTVKALDGAEVIVPNESLISREVVNWTLSDRKRRVEVKVGVAYGTDPHRVIEILRRVAIEHRDATVGIDPEVLFDAFGESSLDFTLQFWARSFADSIELKSEVGLAVHDALVSAGIEIPFPQRDVRIVTPTAAATAAPAPTPAP
jgi:potassium efflux system protein